MKKHKQQHTIDTLFVLTLFCVFTWSAISVVLIGSRIYSASADNMNIVFYNHNAIQYISQKVQQNNPISNIEILDQNGMQVLAIHQPINEVMYTNYIYYENGKLKELLTSSSTPFEASLGTALMDIDTMTLQINDNVLNINLTIDKKEHSTLIHLTNGGIIHE